MVGLGTVSILWTLVHSDTLHVPRRIYRLVHKEKELAKSAHTVTDACAVGDVI